MNRRTLALALAVPAVALGFVACDGPSLPPYDRAAMLRETGEQVILPAYEALEAEAGVLTARSQALCDAPSLTTLSDARDAWRTTFYAWQRTTPHNFGPATSLGIADAIGFWPTRPDTIEGNLRGTDAITESYVNGLGAGGRGVYAIEYLLFAPDDNAAVLTALGDERRCAYLVGVAAHVERSATRLVNEWSPEGEDYVGTFAMAGEAGNPEYLAQLSAVSELMTEVLSALQYTKLHRLAAPLGIDSGTPSATAIETPYARVSVEAMAAVVEGARAVWSVPTHSLDGYLRSRRPAIADDVLAQFDGATTSIRAIPEPFGAYVAAGDLTVGTAAHAQLRALERAIANDAAMTLAVSVMFTDNDGD